MMVQNIDFGGQFDKAMQDPEYGKGMIKIPEGAEVPKGNVILYTHSFRSLGTGLMNPKKYSEERKIYRSDDGKYRFSLYRNDDGKETTDVYPVSDEKIACLNRIIRNAGLSGCSALPHEYIPSFFSPDNTELPARNIRLDLEKENGEIISIPLSSQDIGMAGGNDLLTAIYELENSCTSETKIGFDKFCSNCGAKRIGNAKYCPECGTAYLIS